MSEVVFVGDDPEKDVIIPKKLGMQSILFDPKLKRADFSNRVSNLKELLK